MNLCLKVASYSTLSDRERGVLQGDIEKVGWLAKNEKCVTMWKDWRWKTWVRGHMQRDDAKTVRGIENRKTGRTNTGKGKTNMHSFEHATLIYNPIYPCHSLISFASSMTGSSQWSSWLACCAASQQAWSTCQTWTTCIETWLPVTSWSTVI